MHYTQALVLRHSMKFIPQHTHTHTHTVHMHKNTYTGTYIYVHKKKILIRATYYYSTIYKAIVGCVEVAVSLSGANVRVRYQHMPPGLSKTQQCPQDYHWNCHIPKCKNEKKIRRPTRGEVCLVDGSGGGQIGIRWNTLQVRISKRRSGTRANEPPLPSPPQPRNLQRLCARGIVR